MDSVIMRLSDTRTQLAAKGEAFAARAFGAGESFYEEVRGAGLDFWSSVGGEAKKWNRFATQRASKLRRDVKGLRMRVLERHVLIQVDEALRAADELVRERLSALSPRRARKSAPRAKTLKRTPAAIAA